jgi:hypothetical protein
MPQLAGHGFSQRGIRRVILTMIGDHPQRPFLHRGINLSWHVLILLNSERCGIKPVTIQSALVSSAASRMSSCRWKIRAARPSGEARWVAGRSGRPGWRRATPARRRSKAWRSMKFNASCIGERDESVIGEATGGALSFRAKAVPRMETPVRNWQSTAMAPCSLASLAHGSANAHSSCRVKGFRVRTRDTITSSRPCRAGRPSRPRHPGQPQLATFAPVLQPTFDNVRCRRHCLACPLITVIR